MKEWLWHRYSKQDVSLKSRNSLLERGNTRTSESELAFITTYNPTFQNVGSILQECQILQAPVKEQKGSFSWGFDSDIPKWSQP